MSIKKGDTVRVIYTGKFENGKIFDSSSMHKGEPLEFTVGANQVVPGFDNAVIDKKLNEEFDFQIEPKDGYGEYNKKAIQQLKRSNLPPDLKPEVGMGLRLQQKYDEKVHNIMATIKKVEEKTITVDLNHPLAGKILNFNVKIEEIL